MIKYTDIPGVKVHPSWSSFLKEVSKNLAEMQKKTIEQIKHKKG